MSQDALQLVESFDALYQFATQDANPNAFEPLREPIKRQAAEFQQALLAAEPKQVEAVVRLAADAWRRPLKDGRPTSFAPSTATSAGRTSRMTSRSAD